jgi:hypothetical protein
MKLIAIIEIAIPITEIITFLQVVPLNTVTVNRVW